jgi:hypothetical protein
MSRSLRPLAACECAAADPDPRLAGTIRSGGGEELVELTKTSLRELAAE